MKQVGAGILTEVDTIVCVPKYLRKMAMTTIDAIYNIEFWLP
jgi:hypothetical protein